MIVWGRSTPSTWTATGTSICCRQLAWAFFRGPVDKIAWYEQRVIGDSNDDGIFDSSDLVAVFQAGKYEDGIDDNATFDEGDWDLNGDFDSSDLVAAFRSGHYVARATPRASLVAAAIDSIVATDDDLEDDSKQRRAFVA